MEFVRRRLCGIKAPFGVQTSRNVVRALTQDDLVFTGFDPGRLKTAMYAWEIEGTRLAETRKERNWKRMETEDERWMNEHYKESNTVERLHPWCKGQLLSIDFGRLESLNITTGTLRRLRMLDGTGRIVRSWDNEAGIAVKNKSEEEKEKETKKCFTTDALADTPGNQMREATGQHDTAHGAT